MVAFLLDHAVPCSLLPSMADPLSVTASVIAVVGAATNVINISSSLLRTLRHAPTEICAVINEVEDLRAILVDIEGTKVISAEVWPSIDPAGGICTNRFSNRRRIC